MGRTSGRTSYVDLHGRGKPRVSAWKWAVLVVEGHSLGIWSRTKNKSGARWYSPPLPREEATSDSPVPRSDPESQRGHFSPKESAEKSGFHSKKYLPSIIFRNAGLRVEAS
jgi:hypothetical protein